MSYRITLFFSSALLIVSMLLAGPAYADKPVYSDLDSDGTVVELYIGGDGQVYAIIYHTDGTVSGTNPNPDGDGRGTGKPDYNAIVKKLAAGKGGLPRSSKNTLFNTVLKGKGIVPVWNPSDLASKTGDTGAGGGAESGRDAASILAQAKKGSSGKKDSGSKNGEHGAGGDVNGHKGPDNSSGYKIKPELVNPNSSLRK
ncbi:MAG: hypothetical protein H7228_04310 [Polaromonas sp.]|nr:hypothetical protein [Polaromonas sp.]